MNRFEQDDVLKAGPRNVVREMKRLLAERAEREEVILTWHEQAKRELDRDRESKTSEIEQRAAQTIESLERERDEKIQSVEREFRTKYNAVKEAYKQDRQALLEKAKRNERKAREKVEEAVWLSESVYEGNQDQPREEFEQYCKVLSLAQQEAQQIVEEGRTLLRRARMVGIESSEPGDIETSIGSRGNPDAQLNEVLAEARQSRDALRTMRLPRIYRSVTPIVILFAIAAAGAGIGVAIAEGPIEPAAILGAGAGAAVAIVLLAAGYLFARTRARMAWRTIQARFAEVEPLCRQAREAADRGRIEKERKLKETRDREIAHARKKFGAIIDEIKERRDQRLTRIDEKYPARLKEMKADHQRVVEEMNQEYKRRIDDAQAQRDDQLETLRASLTTREQEIAERYDREWNALRQDWCEGMIHNHALREAIQRNDAEFYPAWHDDSRWESWNPPHVFAPAVRFGKLHVNLNDWPGGLPDREELHIQGPAEFDLPATLSFPDECSLLIERDGDVDQRDIRLLQAVMLRLLTCVPPGKVRFTIFDPVGLGQNFAGFMHLADYNEQFVGGKIWTESRHIEQRLADLTEHMENVIQKYLRNEFETIDEYNAQAGEIAEPYRFLVIADFPINFSETAMRRLASILSSGPRCGVHTLIARDTRQKLPDGLDVEDLRRHNTVVQVREDSVIWNEEGMEDVPFAPESAPDEAFLTRVVNIIGKEALESTRVEVPFEVIAPKDEGLWSLKTDDVLHIALGRSGATKLQHLKLGEGTSQHALVAGKTGSGKSTLLHALITNLMLWYSPDEIELYLVDFKKGVEFKTYARHDLPHIRAVAIESDREFGISVLERLDQEMQRRGERFRELGVQDVAAFRTAAPDERMPRILLIIDEFQEFFTEDDKIGQDAAMLLDRLVRQGRAFGMHVLLGSQTLGGAYSLARSTMGQMGVRLALQCNEADSYLILSEDNAAARLLSRPGEAIYNDANGRVEGNSPFQVVWLPEPVRDAQLKRVQAIARRNEHRPAPPPIVFEGNVPARLEENHLLAAQLEGAGANGGSEIHAWLGESISIKDPTAAIFRSQSGHNLLVIGQRSDAAMGVMASTLISLAACRPDARFVILDGSASDTEDSEAIRALADTLPQDVRIGRLRDVEAIFSEINTQLEQRQSADDHGAPPIFLLIFGLQRFRELRHDDSFSFSMDDEEKPPSPDKLFQTLLREGPPLGMHVVCWCDTVSNLNRTFDRQTLREFEYRVLFQMSPGDSSMLIDSPLASRLGFHRALFSAEEEGRLEKFRPYSLPDRDWLARMRRRLPAPSH